ncbi:MAG: hypothetical protein ABH880_01530 [Patescibacteria group bacterium]
MKTNLEEKAWYRFLKIVYIGTYISAVALILLARYMDSNLSGTAVVTSLVVAILFFELLKRAVLYVAAGRPFFGGKVVESTGENEIHR